MCPLKSNMEEFKVAKHFPKGFYPKWQLPKGIFPNGNCQNVQFLKRQLHKSVLAAALDPPQPVLAAALGPLAHSSRSSKSWLWEST